MILSPNVVSGPVRDAAGTALQLLTIYGGTLDAMEVALEQEDLSLLSSVLDGRDELQRRIDPLLAEVTRWMERGATQGRGQPVEIHTLHAELERIQRREREVQLRMLAYHQQLQTEIHRVDSVSERSSRYATEPISHGTTLDLRS